MANHQAAARGAQSDHLPALLNQAVRNPTRACRFLQRAALQTRDWQELQQRLDGKVRAGTDYHTWISRFEPAPESYPRLRQIADSWQQPPIISVLMPTYNSDVALLAAAIDSVLGQVYPHWQLCVADDASDSPAVKALLERHAAADPRIQVIFRPVNGHISAASNSALALEERYPEIPFTWVELERGGDGIFVLTRDELLAAQAFLD